MTDVDILFQEVQARSAFLKGASIGFDDDPNTPAAPAQITNAPLGTWYHRPGLDLFYRKNLAGVWEEAGSGSDTVVRGAELTLVEPVTLPVAVGGLQVPWDEEKIVNQQQVDDYLASNSATAFAHPQDALNVLPSTLASAVTIECAAGDYPVPPSSSRPPLYSGFADLVIPHFRYADRGEALDGVLVQINGPSPSAWVAVDPVLENVNFSIGPLPPNQGTAFDFTPQAANLLMGFDLLGKHVRDDTSNNLYAVQRLISDDVLEVVGRSLNPSSTLSVVEPSAVMTASAAPFMILQLGNSGRGEVQFNNWRFVSSGSGRILFQYGGNAGLNACQVDMTGVPNSTAHNNTYAFQGLERKQLGVALAMNDCAVRSNPNSRTGPVIVDYEATSLSLGRTVFSDFGGSAYLRAGLAVLTGSVFNNCGALDGVKPTNYGAGSGSRGLERITAAVSVHSVLFRQPWFGSVPFFMICNSPGVGLFWEQSQQSVFDNFIRMVLQDNAGPGVAVGDVSALPFGTAGELQVSGTGNDVGIEFRGNNSVVSFASDTTVTGTSGDVRDRDGLVTSYASVAEGTAVIDSRNNALERAVETGVPTGGPR